MSDAQQNGFACDGADPNSIKWFATEDVPHAIPEYYIDALATAPRKVDILIRVDGTPGTIQAELLERLAHHPKVGTIIIYGLPPARRIPLAALAAMRGINIRFCNSADEMRVLLHKRRSWVLAGSMLDAIPCRDRAGETDIEAARYSG
jgi:hypothetical protein